MEASMAILQQSPEGALESTLSQRVDELIRSFEDRPLLSTTGTQASIADLAARTRGLERALREIAREIQNLTASQ
jgi:hypothetical protein